MIDHLLCVKQLSKHFTCITHLIVTTTLWKRYYHYFHFTDEETKIQSG